MDDDYKRYQLLKELMLQEKESQFDNPIFRTQVLPTVSYQELFYVSNKMVRSGIPLS